MVLPYRREQQEALLRRATPSADEIGKARGKSGDRGGAWQWTVRAGFAVAELTGPQRHLLQNASRRPAQVVAGYPPVNQLAQLGFVEISTMEGSRIWTVTITAAGREALQQAKES